MSPIREKPHRLPKAAYRGFRTVAFTACTEERARFLSDPEVFAAFVDFLRLWCDRKTCLCPVFCLMPDHIHLMLKGTSESSHAKEAMDEIKQSLGQWLVGSRRGCLLQKDYYDHIIRSSEDWRRQAFYILCNPVRAGLVDNPLDYPYSGAYGYDVRELYEALTT